MEITVPFGKYAKKGQSWEQVAINDFSYFTWILGKVNSSFHKEYAEGINSKLRQFQPQNCCQDSNCNHKAKYFSLYNNSNAGNYFSTGLGYAYCSNEHYQANLHADSGKTHLAPISFSILDHIPTKGNRDDLTETILQSAGFTGRKTKKSLEEFIKNLTIQV